METTIATVVVFSFLFYSNGLFAIVNAYTAVGNQQTTPRKFYFNLY